MNRHRERSFTSRSTGAASKGKAGETFSEGGGLGQPANQFCGTLLHYKQQHRQHELQYSAKVNLRVKVKINQVGIFMFSMTKAKPLI